MSITERNDKRCKQLMNLGLIYQGAEFIKDDINVHWTELTCDTDEQFEKKVSSIKAEMARRLINHSNH